jgi:hypothetical protein
MTKTPPATTGGKVTRQGVRDLNGPTLNNRKLKDPCFHEFEHDRECSGCWAEQFGGYDKAPHTYICRRCKEPRIDYL